MATVPVDGSNSTVLHVTRFVQVLGPVGKSNTVISGKVLFVEIKADLVLLIFIFVFCMHPFVV